MACEEIPTGSWEGLKNMPQPTIDNSKETRKTFATRSHLREIREARGMTQVQLAGIVVTSPQIISKAEHGRILQIRTSMLIRIAVSLDVGVADLWPIFGAKLK